MEKVTIVYAHPYEKSFNHAILERVQELLTEQQKEYTVLDLYADNFNPVFAKEELALYSKGEALDPLIKTYQAALADTTSLIFIFPIWWSDMPAILKGFFDKVMLNGFAYVSTGVGIEGILTQIKTAKIITTSEEATSFIETTAGDAINKVLIGSILHDIGIGKSEWTNWPEISQTDEAARKQFLADLTV